MPLYSVATWDANRQAYTPQRGLSVPTFNITLAQLRQAMRELRAMGHDANDAAVLIERTDGACWKTIMRSWRR